MENKVISKEYVEKNYIYKDVIREILHKDRNIMAFGFHSAYLELIQEFEEILEDK